MSFAPVRYIAKSLSFPRRLDVRMIRRWLPDLAGGRMLDVGCGDGYWTGRIARWCRARADGVDVSASAIEQSDPRPGDLFRLASAEDLPFADGVFDLVVSLSVLQFVRRGERALREMHRVLRPGGALVLTCDAMDHPRISADYLRLHRAKYAVADYWPLQRLTSAVERAGFDVLETARSVSSPLASRIMHLQERFGKAVYAAAPVLYPTILASDAVAGGPGGHKAAIRAARTGRVGP